MHPESPSGVAPDLVEALVARVDEIDAHLRATTAAIDEKSLREFRKTFETISKRDARFEERLTDKVDVVADRLETITRTVSTTSAALAAKDGEIAQLRRELDSGNARLDSALAEMRRGLDPTALNEVKRTVADLARQKLPRGLEGRIDELGAKLTMLAQRIDTVSSTVSTTAAGLAGRDGDVIALRRAHEVESTRIDSELADLRRAVDPAPIAEAAASLVGASSARAPSSNDPPGSISTRPKPRWTRSWEDSRRSRRRTTRLHPALPQAKSTSRRFALTSKRAACTCPRSPPRSQLRASASTRRTSSSRTSSAGSTTRPRASMRSLPSSRRALAELPDLDSAQQLLDARLSELDRTRIDDRVRIEEVADRLEAVAASTEVIAGRAPAHDALELRIDELAELIEAAAVERDETSGDVGRLAALLEVERAAVRSRLESLAASHEGAIGSVSADELELQVAAFGARVDSIERERAAQGARLERLTSAFDSERESFQTQLEALATALSWTSPKSASADRLDELARRMESLELRSDAVAEKVAHATTLLPTALRSLEARLEELTPGPRGTTAVEPVSSLPRALRSLESSPFLADDELDEDDTPHRLPEPVVPLRGTDP